MKQLVSLFNNFFGVTFIFHLVKIPGSRLLFRTCASVMFCFRAHSKRPANITRNLIGVADNNNVHSIGSQKHRERNVSLSGAAVSEKERCVTTLITAAKETDESHPASKLTRDWIHAHKRTNFADDGLHKDE